MRVLFVLAASLALSACETTPEWLQSATTPRATTSRPALTPASATSTAAPAATPAPAPAYAPPPQQQLLELERQLSATAQARGLGTALAGVIDANDGMVVRSGAAYSASDVEAGLASTPGSGPMYWQPDRVHVSSAGDMGLTTGRYVQVMTGAEAVQGRYTIVWRRNGAGEWRVLSETRVADPPRARTPARRR